MHFLPGFISRCFFPWLQSYLNWSKGERKMLLVYSGEGPLLRKLISLGIFAEQVILPNFGEENRNRKSNSRCPFFSSTQSRLTNRTRGKEELRKWRKKESKTFSAVSARESFSLLWFRFFVWPKKNRERERERKKIFISNSRHICEKAK